MNVGIVFTMRLAFDRSCRLSMETLLLCCVVLFPCLLHAAQEPDRLVQLRESYARRLPEERESYLNDLNKLKRNLASAGDLEGALAVQQEMGKYPGPERVAGGSFTNGLVLYLPFDKPATNGITADASGAGNHGKVAGGVWIPNGRVGGAYQFDIKKLDQCVVVPDSDSLAVELVTVSAWIKSKDNDGFWNRILDKDYRNGYNLCLGGDFQGKSFRGIAYLEINGHWVPSDKPVADGEWHHLVGTFDGSEQRLYVDGIQQKGVARWKGNIGKNKSDIGIGNSKVDYGTQELLAFDGIIDEVRVYNRALTPAEVKTLYAAVTPTPAGDPDAKANPAERMRRLKELYDKGLIGKEAFEKKSKEILDSL